MSERRGEPFAIAFLELRRRILEGDYTAEARLAANELATELKLSATPVREALCRLAGEGLLEDRRGQGFFVRRLARRDIAALYQLRLAHLVIALESSGPAVVARDIADADGAFSAWVQAAGVRALSQSFERIQAQLAPARRLESEVLGDLDGEAAALARATDARARLAELRRFHRRRIRAAGRLAERLEQ